MLELNKLYNMDCMQGMAEFPDGFFDLAIVDPPSPVWEDCTNAVVAGHAHVFENTLNTAAQCGMNIRVTVKRGTALTNCWVSGIGGNFE